MNPSRHPSTPHLFPRGPFLSAITSLLLLWQLFPVASLLAVQEDPPVDCPGFERSYPLINAPMGLGDIPPSLVVLGTAQKDGDSGGCRVKIEKVLYGSYVENEVTYSSFWNHEGRGIYFLSPAHYKEKAPYDCWDIMAASDLAAAQALCDSRFDGVVLGASSIFVGTEVPPPPKPDEKLPFRIPPGTRVIHIGGGGEWDDYKHEVKVVRFISGKPVKAGETITAIIDGFIRRSDGGEQPMHAEQRLYFVSDAMKDPVDNRPAYRVFAALPMDLEQRVTEALKRRDSYPMGEDQFRPGEKRLEILFRGTVDEAVSFLSADSLAAVHLAQRYFLRHPADSRKALVAKISAGIFVADVAKDHEFRDQERYIDALASIELASPSGAIPALVDQLISKLEKDHPPVPMPQRDEKKLMTGEGPWGHSTRIPEEDTTDVNHTLTWLMLKVDEREARRLWGKRLLALQPGLTGWWKHEVDLAISANRIAQNDEFAALLAKMEEVKPLHADPAFSQINDLRSLAISRDGSYLAASGPGENIRIIGTADWKTLATLPHEGGSMAFSPDANFLYVRGPVDHTLFTRYEWRSGRVDKSYAYDGGWTDRMILSRDGAVMVTACYADEKMLVWDTTTGMILRTIVLPKSGYAVALSADGKTIARTFSKSGESDRPDKTDILVEPVLERISRQQHVKCDYHVGKMEFTPDGRYLITMGGAEPGKNLCHVHDLVHGGKTVATAAYDAQGVNAVVISPSGKYLAVSDQSRDARLYALPSLKLLWSTSFGENNEVDSVVFSGDEKMLVLGQGNQANPRYVSTETFKEVTPFPGDAGRIVGISFSQDGSQVTSFGGQGTICHRNAGTLELLDRVGLPAEYSLLAASPGGDYALCIDRKSKETPISNVPRTIKIIDSKSGHETAAFTLPLGYWLPVYWTSNDTALIFGFDGESITRLDCAHGKILSQVKVDNSKIDERGFLYLSADGLSLIAHDDFSQSNPWTRLDLVSGEMHNIAIRKTGDKSLLVDGVPFRLLDSRVFQPDSPVFQPDAPELPKLIRISDYRPPLFCAAAHRLVRIVQDDDAPANQDPRIINNPLIIGYDTVSMKPLFAFRSAHGCAAANIDANAGRLVVAGVDGSIEIWPLPW